MRGAMTKVEAGEGIKECRVAGPYGCCEVYEPAMSMFVDNKEVEDDGWMLE